MVMRLKRVLKWVAVLVGLFFFYIIFFLAVPPLRHMEADGVQWESYVEREAVRPEAGGCERVRCIDDNNDALIWRLRLIEAARESIVLSTFDFGDDNSGRRMMAALLAASERGVSVRIVVDGINGFLKLSGSRSFSALAAASNVEVRFYNPVNVLTPWKLNYRMHDKYLIVDDFAYILGGRNTNDLFLGDYREDRNIDRDILVLGARSAQENVTSLEQVISYFESVWALSSCRPYQPFGSWAADYSGEWAALRGLYDEMRAEFPTAFGEVDWRGETAEANRVSLLANPIEAENKEPELWYALSRLMERGRDIVIQTPYVICSDGMYEDLASLCEGGRKLQVILNAVEGGANPFGCTDYLNEKKHILDIGTEVYELLGGWSSHTKTILVNSDVSVVGSYNLDMRSTYLDTETMLVIDCRELNAYLRQCARADMQKSKRVMPDGTESFGELYQPITPALGKRIFYKILRFIVRPIRHLL